MVASGGGFLGGGGGGVRVGVCDGGAGKGAGGIQVREVEEEGVSVWVYADSSNSFCP